jgi:hypothetical protein
VTTFEQFLQDEAAVTAAELESSTDSLDDDLVDRLVADPAFVARCAAQWSLLHRDENLD